METHCTCCPSQVFGSESYSQALVAVYFGEVSYPLCIYKLKRAPQDPVLSAKESFWPQRERGRDKRQRQDTEEQGEGEESKGERRKEGKGEGEELFVLGGQRTASG